MKQLESRLQSECVKWFRLQYPKEIIFAIPNGGNRDAITGAILKREGALSGVADLFVMRSSGKWHGLFIEMKSGKGKLSESQVRFGESALSRDYLYAIVNSFDTFRSIVENYLIGVEP